MTLALLSGCTTCSSPKCRSLETARFGPRSESGIHTFRPTWIWTVSDYFEKLTGIVTNRMSSRV